MKNKSNCLSVLVLALAAGMTALSGCAKDRTVEDYRSGLYQQQEAAMSAVQGDYRGSYVSSLDGKTVIGGLTIHVDPDRVTSSASGDPVASQQAVLKITVSLSGSSTKTLTFTNGSFDRTSSQFKATTTVLNRGNAQMKGTFAGDTLTGTLEVEGYPSRGGSFALRRGADAPALVGIRTRTMNEEQFLFNNFSAIGNFRKKSPNPEDDRINMTILRQTSVQEQDLMDIITPYRYVDLSVFFNSRNADGTHHQIGGIFSNAVWDIGAGTLRGTYTATAGQGLAATELQLLCTQTAVGWNCQEIALTNANSKVFTADFVPTEPSPEDGQ